MHAHQNTYVFYALLITTITLSGCITQSTPHCPKGTTPPCPTTADVWEAQANGTANTTTTQSPLTYSVAHAKQTLRYNLTRAVPTSQYTLNQSSRLTNMTLIINVSMTKPPLQGTTAIRLTNPEATVATTSTTINGNRPRRIAIYANNTWHNTSLDWTNTTPTQTTRNT